MTTLYLHVQEDDHLLVQVEDLRLAQEEDRLLAQLEDLHHAEEGGVLPAHEEDCLLAEKGLSLIHISEPTRPY